MVPLRRQRANGSATRAGPHGDRRTQRGLSKISRRDAQNHPALGHWQDCDELWVLGECVHVRSSSVSSVRSASDRTKHLITRSDSLVRVLTLSMFLWGFSNTSAECVKCFSAPTSVPTPSRAVRPTVDATITVRHEGQEKDRGVVKKRGALECCLLEMVLQTIREQHVLIVGTSISVWNPSLRHQNCPST